MFLCKGVSVFWCLQFGCLVVNVVPQAGEYSYVLCFMENDADSFKRDDTSIFVINPTNDSVQVLVPRLNSSIILLPGEGEALACPGELFHVIGSGIQDKGINIQSNGRIAVEGLNRIQSSTDTFLVRPTSLLSREYLAVTYCNGTLACQVAVVATDNNTSIAIYFPYTVDLIMENGDSYTYGPNKNLLVALQAYQVYQIQSRHDLTGLVVTANKPVACFAGANQTGLLDGTSIDHVVSELPPTQAWGYDYIFAGSVLASFTEIVKIIATEGNTFVVIDSCANKTIILPKAFDYIENVLMCGGYIIHSNFKIIVAHIRIKSNTGMYFPFPTSIFASSYTVYIPNTIVGAHTSSVVLYAETSDTDNLVLNGTLLTSTEWKPILDTHWSYLSVNVESGLLTIYNDLNKPFGGHLLVRNSFKLSVMNLIPVPYNESVPDCCEHLEEKINSFSSTEGSGAGNPQSVSTETAKSEILTTTSDIPTTTSDAVTSPVIQSTSQNLISSPGCCFCGNNTTKNYRIWTLQELRDLTMIDKKNTSIAIRKLTSARDDRLSAIGIGYCGIAVLCTVFACIMSIDLSEYCCRSAKVSPKK